MWVMGYSCLETVPPINTMSESSRRTALTIGAPADKALMANTDARSTAGSTVQLPRVAVRSCGLGCRTNVGIGRRGCRSVTGTASRWRSPSQVTAS